MIQVNFKKKEKEKIISNKRGTLEEIQRFCSCVDAAEPQGQRPQVAQR